MKMNLHDEQDNSVASKSEVGRVDGQKSAWKPFKFSSYGLYLKFWLLVNCSVMKLFRLCLLLFKSQIRQLRCLWFVIW